MQCPLGGNRVVLEPDSLARLLASADGVAVGRTDQIAVSDGERTEHLDIMMEWQSTLRGRAAVDRPNIVRFLVPPGPDLDVQRAAAISALRSEDGAIVVLGEGADGRMSAPLTSPWIVPADPDALQRYAGEVQRQEHLMSSWARSEPTTEERHIRNLILGMDDSPAAARRAVSEICRIGASAVRGLVRSMDDWRVLPLQSLEVTQPGALVTPVARVERVVDLVACLVEHATRGQIYCSCGANVDVERYRCVRVARVLAATL